MADDEKMDGVAWMRGWDGERGGWVDLVLERDAMLLLLIIDGLGEAV